MVNDTLAANFNPHTPLVSSATVEKYIRHKHNPMLLYRRYDPPTKPVASFCIFHGFGEHSKRYEHMANAFRESGLVVHTIDFQGFGYSGGARSASTLEEHEKDVKTCLRQVDPNLPVFILGHSMGGLTVLKFCLDHPNMNIGGVIFSSALFRLHESRSTPWWKRYVVRLLGCFKEIFLIGDVDPTHLTRDHQEIINILQDRFCMPMMGVKLARTVVHWPLTLFPRRVKEFTYPVLVFHGKLDSLTDPEASCKFYSLVSSTDKTLKIFEHSYHEVHQDINRHEMYTLVKNWILTRVQASKPLGDIETYENPFRRQKQLQKYAWRMFKPLWDNMFVMSYIATICILFRKYMAYRRSRKNTSIARDMFAIIRCVCWPLEATRVVWKQMMLD